MTEDEVIVEGDRVRCVNPESHRLGRVGTVVEVVEKPTFRTRMVAGKPERVCVLGDPMNGGETFAWVLYDDGVRTPHDLTNLRLEV